MALVPRTRTKKIVKKTVSAQHTPNGTDRWHQHTGNSILLNTPGYWKLSGTVSFGRTSGAPYDQMKIVWSNENGDNTNSTPNSIPSPTLVHGSDYVNQEVLDLITGSLSVPVNEIIVLSTGVETIFLDTYASDNGGAFANMRITVQMVAEFIGSSDLVTVA